MSKHYILHPCPGTHTCSDLCVSNAQTPATLRTPVSILLSTGLFLVSWVELRGWSHGRQHREDCDRLLCVKLPHVSGILCHIPIAWGSGSLLQYGCSESLLWCHHCHFKHLPVFSFPVASQKRICQPALMAMTLLARNDWKAKNDLIERYN